MLEIVNQLDGFDPRGNVKVRGHCHHPMASTHASPPVVAMNRILPAQPLALRAHAQTSRVTATPPPPGAPWPRRLAL